MGLKKLPKPDGAPLDCSVFEKIETWPFVQKCKAPAAGLLSWDDYKQMQQYGYTGMRAVCEKHGTELLKLLEELR